MANILKLKLYGVPSCDLGSVLDLQVPFHTPHTFKIFDLSLYDGSYFKGLLILRPLTKISLLFLKNLKPNNIYLPRKQILKCNAVLTLLSEGLTVEIILYLNFLLAYLCVKHIQSQIIHF